MTAEKPRRSVWESERAWIAFMCLAAPLAPLWYPLCLADIAWQLRQRRRYRAVTRSEIDGDAFVLSLDDGSVVRVMPETVREAVERGWGDGENGTECETALVIDGRLRLRGDDFSAVLAPLVEALARRNVLRRARRYRPHPSEGPSYLFFLLLLGIVIDLLVLAIVFALQRR